MSKHEYSIHHPIRIHSQVHLAARLNLLRRGFSDEGRHRLPEGLVPYRELPDGTVFWGGTRKAFMRRDDSLPSGWVQRIYPRVANSFRTAE
ncbi:hypothetical protein MRGORDO_41 [Mycobacterium phage MrGordo]|uniref:Uncharacterized protein n=1 Tax=Mycobacterium phage MrGordo TaxID=2847995 RepID=G1DTT0_9CAUD|nr:hypothetical protein FGG31_gp41 [Mycobacterium phage MrGordon]AEJ92975.1 hypothetical protein MRGORDO_41 [Mycobacterium phage MrGordon]